MYNNIPEPIDTSRVSLTPELKEAVDVIARNIHSVWVYKRISEGWVYGDKYDESAKTTPWLIEYGNLPESERDTDRQTVEQTIKTLLLFGYKIEGEDGK